MIALGWLACAAPAPRELVWGQWVWTGADAAVFRRVSADVPDLGAAVLVAEVSAAGTALRTSPRAVPAQVVVIRLDDDLHARYDTLDDAAVAAALDPELAKILAMVDRAVGPLPIQLDDDCPVRLLPRCAAVLGRLRQGTLRGRDLWVTSLVAHVRDPAYGPAFAPVVTGHVLQLFDTGDDALDARAVGDAAVGAGVRYRVGLGAFERTSTDHRAWFDRLDEVCRAPLCDGVWVFPAGRDWSPPR